jgi:uncharacterized membrane protein
MIPFFVLLIGFISFYLFGLIGVAHLSDWETSLHWAVALMFLITASAHWGKRREDLIEMVPTSFSIPSLLVTLTGVLEIIGAIGLLIPLTSNAAAICLALLLVALFPANIKASKNRHSIGGIQTTTLLPRTLLQLVFIAAVLLPILPF